MFVCLFWGAAVKEGLAQFTHYTRSFWVFGISMKKKNTANKHVFG